MSSKSRRERSKSNKSKRKRKRGIGTQSVTRGSLTSGVVSVSGMGVEVIPPSYPHLISKYLYLSGFENSKSYSLADVYLNSYLGFISRLGAYARVKDGLVLGDRSHLSSYLGKVVKVTGTVFCVRNFEGRLRVLLHTPSIVNILRGRIGDISFEDMLATPDDFTAIELDNHIWVDISSSHLVVEEGIYSESNEYGSIDMELVAGSKLTLCATLGLYKGYVNGKDGGDAVKGLKIGFVGDTYLLSQELYILREIAPSDSSQGDSSQGIVLDANSLTELEYDEFNVIGTVDIGFGFNLGRELSLGSLGYNFNVCRSEGNYLCASNCRFTVYQSSQPSKFTYSIFNEMRRGSSWDDISRLIYKELYSAVECYSREFSSFYMLLSSRASRYLDLSKIEGYNSWVSTARLRNRLASSVIGVECY